MKAAATVATVFALMIGAGSAAAANGGRPLSATLTGAAEVPGPGDPDGAGEAYIILNSGQGEVCFQLSVTGVDDITGAHIHVGGPLEVGPVVVPLTPPHEGFSSGCVPVDPELVKNIRQNPENYYVNLHSLEFRAGAVRGQLTK